MCSGLVYMCSGLEVISSASQKFITKHNKSAIFSEKKLQLARDIMF